MDGVTEVALTVSDAPMPADAMDQISLYTNDSPRPVDGAFQQGYFPAPKRSKSHLKVHSHSFLDLIAPLKGVGPIVVV